MSTAVPPPLPAASTTPKKSRLGIGIAIGVIAFFVVATAAAVFAYAFFNAANEPLTDAQKRLLVSAEDFQELYELELGGEACRDYDRMWLPGSTRTFSYSYDSDLDSNADFLYVTSEAEFNNRESAARESMKLSIVAYKAGMGLVPGRTMEELEVEGLGDEHYVATIKDDGEVIGSLVVIRQGKVLQEVFALGVFFESADEIRAVAGEALKAGANYNP